MHWTLDCFGNPLTIVEHSSIIRDNLIVPLNFLQKKAIFEIFLGFHCHEQNFSYCMKYIFFHTLLICLQIEQLVNVY
jgi:hypothetical protein